MGKRSRLVVPALLLAGIAQAQEAPNPSFYLVNRSPVAITRVFASPAGQPSWGSDRLGGPIAPGGNAPVRLPADGTCLFDVRVQFGNGRSEERRGLNSCSIDTISFPGGRTTAATGTVTGTGTGTGTAARAGDPSFLLVNRGRVTLSELYVSPADDDSWGEDRLGDSTLRTGRSLPIHMPTGPCVYDLRAVFDNGDANEKRHVNLCEIVDVRVP